LNFMGSNHTLILVYKSMHHQHQTGLVDVMLTPEFYVLKKEVLPVRYAYQAKKVAPALFDGLLDDDGYDFFVYKEGEEWVFIAYHPEQIAAFLKRKGIEPAKVGKVYFAEQIVDKLEQPIRLGEKHMLMRLNDMAVVVPGSGSEALPMQPFSQSFRPNKGVGIESASSRSLFSKKEAVFLAVPFVIFGVLWIAEGVHMKKAGGKDTQKLMSLYEENPALQSSYARESILSKYRTVDTLERKKRELLKKVAKSIFKGVTLTEAEVDDTHYKFTFSLAKESTQKRLEKVLKENGLSPKKGQKSKEVIVEGAL